MVAYSASKKYFCAGIYRLSSFILLNYARNILTTMGIILFYFVWSLSQSISGGNQIDHPEVGLAGLKTMVQSRLITTLNGQINLPDRVAILANLILCVAIAWFL